VRRGDANRVILHVERTNPAAHRLYRRLGFAESPPTSPYPGLSIEMIWTGSAN
jgi:GNAT superfamily N-acetyltransferase